MKLIEILNTTGKFKVIKKKDDAFVASAKIDGREIHFYADRKPGNKEHWEVGFGEPFEDDPDELDFELSGKGGEFKVFAMVKAALEKFVYVYDPDQITMSADKKHGEAENRGRVYERLLKKFALKDYKLTKSDNGHFEIFTLDKVKHADK